MKERFIVATLSQGPELEAVYWAMTKEQAVEEIQRRKQFYFREQHILAKILNVPSKHKEDVKTESK